METAGLPVVDRSDQRDRNGAEHDAARLLASGHEEQRGDHHRREDRQTTQAGHRALMQVAVTRLVDHSEPARQPGDGRSGCERDQRSDEERPQGIELVHLTASLMSLRRET